MADLKIKTELDNLVYTPGEILRGQVYWDIDLVKNSDGGEVRLFYYTSGKGTQDVKVINTLSVPATSTKGNQKFEFTLPSEPYSFSGKLISLIWALEFQMLESDETERLEFVMSPSGKEVDLYAHSDGSLPSYSNIKIG